MKGITLILFFLGISNLALGQNLNVREQDVLFRKHLVRALSLRDPRNVELFGENAVLSEILLNALEKGNLLPYRDRLCKEEVSREEILSKVIMSEEDSIGFIFSHTLKEIELGEDIIFDKHRSEFVFEQKYIALIIPQTENYRGITEPLAYFKYDDCSRVFNMDERAYSLNFSGVKVPFNDLFLTHTYKSYIVKIGNGNYFDQVYPDPLKAFIAARHQENVLNDYLYRFFNP
ncbi:MAG: hypothetical protein J7604_00210 [Sporocytophaga sp.]|uniref:hypothetical protein n=1 Tax=Sporocytophaga sp. TaxID=2231183 RepID=UPI001B0955D8|nr:hypothetical protein [Sporocytophaga sp.]MBO9698594.1 hypothetical protein [Sporocytophaga sp.]